MIKKLISSVVQGLYGATQPFATASVEYGGPPPEPVPMYGSPSPIDIPAEIPPKMSVFLPFLFLILIPIILLVGVFALAKKKQFSKKERIGAAIIVLSVYFVVLISAIAMIYVL